MIVDALLMMAIRTASLIGGLVTNPSQFSHFQHLWSMWGKCRQSYTTAQEYFAMLICERRSKESRVVVIFRVEGDFRGIILASTAMGRRLALKIRFELEAGLDTGLCRDTRYLVAGNAPPVGCV